MLNVFTFLAAATGTASSSSPVAAPVVKEWWAVYPDWVVVLAVTAVLAVGLWLFMKLLKVMMWLMIIGVLVAGVLTAAWMLVK